MALRRRGVAGAGVRCGVVAWLALALAFVALIYEVKNPRLFRYKKMASLTLELTRRCKGGAPQRVVMLRRGVGYMQRCAPVRCMWTLASEAS